MSPIFDELTSLNRIRHYLPTQSPLKDFIHHNTLHALQHLSFFEAAQTANEAFGYKSLLTLVDYRRLYKAGKISHDVLRQVVAQAGEEDMDAYIQLMMTMSQNLEGKRRIGRLRSEWKNHYRIDLNTKTHPNLFRFVGSFLDQGVGIVHFPHAQLRFIEAIITLQDESFFDVFHSSRVKQIIRKPNRSIRELLKILVGKEEYYEQYLFDQQFAHPGWSGMVSMIESNPGLFYDTRDIRFEDFVYFELLLEIDALDHKFGEHWKPLGQGISMNPITDLMGRAEPNAYWKIKRLWQEAYEMTYFSQVLEGLRQVRRPSINTTVRPDLQAFFCIDDRSESLRRHLENTIPNCETYGTPSHFSLEMEYKPFGGKFTVKTCPASVEPKHVVNERTSPVRNVQDMVFSSHSHGFFGGLLITQTLGFWTSLKLFWNLFKPSISPAYTSAFEHMHRNAELITENEHGEMENGLLVGFRHEDKVAVLAKELKSVGLTNGFAPLVYFIGHGASSTNNPYYAAYNCGACSGRPSSVNARIISQFANDPSVRKSLAEAGIIIPSDTQFLGGLHDTTRDEISFYDPEQLTASNLELHEKHVASFEQALSKNARERARQFVSINLRKSTRQIHEKIKERAYALFEPRPEYNHSNNCLCIVGPRWLSKSLFLDQRAFLNSYDSTQDSDGKLLESILNSITPVCGGINLEYFFSRVDNENFGAGSKLPHNVVGLFGVANGIEGDLRTGLPMQMVEVHDPLRLMMIIHHSPEVVLRVIQRNEKTFEWYKNEWVRLVSVNPETHKISVYKQGQFHPYEGRIKIPELSDFDTVFQSSHENLPVFKIVA